MKHIRESFNLHFDALAHRIVVVRLPLGILFFPVMFFILGIAGAVAYQNPIALLMGFTVGIIFCLPFIKTSTLEDPDGKYQWREIVWGKRIKEFWMGKWY